MTYFELIRLADHLLDNGSITIGDHEKMLEPLRREVPSIQPEPRTGHWEYMQYDSRPNIGNWHCSECGRVVFLLKSQKSGETPLYDYCPWCGARMESETEQGLSYADKDTLMPATQAESEEDGE